ncbi:hypothetical protein KY284_030650 [Solanum tuberosum]|nr:hypothetical protein KY284_030650 [Solanum tuberosum]
MVDLQAEANSSSSHLHVDPTLVRLDFASPLYLHPSESAGSSLLPAVFDGTGYRSWRRAVLRALSVKSKTGFINGTLVRPAPTDPGFLQWERCDDMLQKEINDLVQGPLDITGYYTRMKKLWEEMSTIDVNSQCTCVCTCGGKTKLHKAEQDRRLIHFLMGLNEMYTSIRGNILMMSTLPSMAQAFTILSQEEKQRDVKPNNHTVLDSTSLNAHGQSSNSAALKDFKTNYSSTRGGGNNSGNFNNNNVFRDSSSTTRSSIFCEYCKRSGHTKDRCYKLHGYPPNSRFPKGKGSGSAGNVCASEMNGHGHQNEKDPALKKKMPLNLSKVQYEQLLNLLGTLQMGNGNSNFDNSDNMMSGAVNLAGILACYSSITEIGDLSCRCAKLTAGSWIIDSGASHHMTYNKTILKNIRPLPYPF